ncbi:MAG TPA: helix-turn-helix domain-containing protein [Bacillota bacterium]|nr:helix-turn-helix domain-containing protein [Bacillota bacterium]
MATDEFSTRGAPWSLRPSFEAVCRDAGVDYNRFIRGQKENRADNELAVELGVSPTLITNLRKRWEKYGLDSMQGQD